MNLGDDAPLLTGLPRDEAAAAKLAHALGRRVAQLRRELEGALSFVPDSQAEMPDLLKRREALREEIAKLGATATLIESLDDPHGDLAGLPRDLAGLTRVELVAKLEESLEAMRGSELLSERDHALMTKKVRKVKAQEFGIFGDGVQRAGEQLKKHWSEAQARGQKMSPEQLSQLREMVQREARAARVGEKIADSLAEKRRELAALLATKPASVEARRAQEERAAQLMREIRDLDELSHSVEAGEEISAEQKSLFAAQEAEEDVFVFKAGGPEEADVARALSQLGALKGSLQRAKENSAGAEKVLRQAIRGEPAPAKEEPKIDLRAVRVERLDRAKEKVLAWQESVKESGMEASPSDVVELRQSVAGEIERSRWIVNIDAKLAEAQRQLGKLLRVEAVGDQEKAEMEEQTLLLQDDIQEMRALRDGLQAGDEIEASRLEGYVAGGDTALPGTQAGDIGQVLDSIDSLKRAAITVGREARAAGEEANAQLATSDFEALKDKAVSATGLDAVKKKLSRHLKEFLKTGRSIDQEAIWQINHDIAKQVQHAQAAASIARAQVRATQELRALQASAPADAAESAELGRKISAKTAEIAELQNIGGALERGESVDEATLKNHGGEVDEKFVFTADRSPPETITRIAGALESLQEDLVSIKREAMDALAETVLKGEARPGEGARHRHRRGQQGRRCHALRHRHDSALHRAGCA